MSNPSPATVAAAAPVRGSIELSDLQRTTSRTRSAHIRHDSGYGETVKAGAAGTVVRDHSPADCNMGRLPRRSVEDVNDSGYGETVKAGAAGTVARDHSPADYNMDRLPRRSIESKNGSQNPFSSSKDAFASTPSASYPPTRSGSASDLAMTPTAGRSGANGRAGNLTPTDAANSTNDLDVNPLLQSLLPVDGGKHAWLFLVGATTIEILIYGFSFSIGILHLHWTSMFGEANSSTVTLASTLQAGMLYMLLGIVGPVLAAFPRYSKHIQVGGLLIASAGLIGTAFITEPWHLIVTIGMLFPFATATYMPCCILLFEWFQARRGLAAGIMYAGTGVGGTIFPFIITGLISKVGYRAAMCSIGIAFLAFGCLALIPIKRRVPLPRKARLAGEGDEMDGQAESMRVARPNLSFMRRPQVWIGAGIIMVSSMGTFVPTLWLPYDLQVSPGGTGLISIMNAASVPGNALIGYLSDRYPIHTVIIGNCVVSSLVCFFLWGFGTNAGTLVTFVILFGAVGLSFAALWTRMLGLIARDDPTVPAVAFSIFAVGRGIGSVTSGPIADVLLKIDVLRGAAGGYGVKNYGILLIYTGASIMVAAAMGFAFTDKQRTR